MEIAGEYVFDAPQASVWQALLDPNVLGAIMPGGKGFDQTGENQYNGVLEVKVGPVQGTFQGQIKLSDVVAPESYRIEVDGKGAPGFVKATGNLRLEARDAQTFMAYSGQAQIGGRIASVGQRLIDSAAKSIIRQSLDALNEYLKAQGAQPAPQTEAPATVVPADAAPAESVSAPTASDAPAAAAVAAPPAVTVTMPSSYKPPSQMSLALNVARDVLNDIVPAKYQPVLFGAIIVIVVLVLWKIAAR